MPDTRVAIIGSGPAGMDLAVEPQWEASSRQPLCECHVASA